MSSQRYQLPSALAHLSSELAAFYEAWRACGQGAMVPALSDYLDAPPFRLQPYVSILDVHSPLDLRLRLFGTGLVTLAGQDFTGHSVGPVYDADSRTYAGDVIWAATGHPAGFTCVRGMKTSTNMVIECNCVCLPLKPARNVPRCLISLLHLPAKTPQAHATQELRNFSGYRFLGWIDIGAGLPAIGKAK